MNDREFKWSQATGIVADDISSTLAFFRSNLHFPLLNPDTAIHPSILMIEA